MRYLTLTENKSRDSCNDDIASFNISIIAGYVHRLLRNCIMENHLKVVGKSLLNQSSKLPLTRPMHIIQQLKLWKALDFSGKSFFNLFQTSYAFFQKPGLGISCKNRKYMFADTFLLSFLCMPWSSHSCNDHRYSYFTRNICNRYADCFETLLFRT